MALQYHIGIDEVGRGPLAGPVAVGAFVFIDPTAAKLFRGVKDSKQLTEEKREAWFSRIEEERASGRVNYAVTFVSEKVIDEKGLSYALRYALTKSLSSLALKPEQCRVLLDGGLKAPVEYVYQQTIIRGDEKRKVIALASIAAKVLRDRAMKKYAQVYEGYGFEQHKGYATERHYSEIARRGLCPIHRRSFLKLALAITLALVSQSFFVPPLTASACTLTIAGDVTPKEKDITGYGYGGVGGTGYDGGNTSWEGTRAYYVPYGGHAIAGSLKVTPSYSDCFVPVKITGTFSHGFPDFQDPATGKWLVGYGDQADPVYLGAMSHELIPYDKPQEIAPGKEQTFFISEHSSPYPKEFAYDPNNLFNSRVNLVSDWADYEISDVCGSGARVTLNSQTYTTPIQPDSPKQPMLVIDRYDGAEVSSPSLWRKSKIEDIKSDIRVQVLPAFVEKLKNENHLTPSGLINPLDDIAVRLTARQCPGHGLTFSASIMTVDSQGKEQLVDTFRSGWDLLYNGKFISRDEAIQKMGQKAVAEYEKGPVREFYTTIERSNMGMGIGTAGTNWTKYKLLVDSIAKGRRVFVRIKEEDGKNYKDQDLTMTNCVPFYGSGPNSIAVLQDKDLDNLSLSPGGVSIPFNASLGMMLTAVDGFRKEGVEKIDPYKTYKDSFSYYLDLTPVDDSSWLTIPFLSSKFFLSGASNVKRASACKNVVQYIFINNKTYRAYAPWGSGVAFLTSLAGPTAHIAIHELGHSFASLVDEYVQLNPLGRTFGPALMNCSLNPKTDFSYNSTYYGDGTYKGCTNSTSYRGSENDLMRDYNDTNGEKMNVIGCGYVLAKIKGGSAKSRFPECGTLDVVQKHL